MNHRITSLLILLFLFFVSATFCQAQVLLAPAKKDGKWGFINTQGEWVIKPTYDKVQSFKDNLAAANMGYSFNGSNATLCKPGKWGFINAKGEWVIKPSFSTVEAFEEGLAKVNLGAEYRNYQGITLMGGKWGFINTNGQWIIPANDTLYAQFSEGLCAFKVPRGSRWGYIDRSGKTIITPAYWEAGAFADGLAPVLNENYSYTYITKEGVAAAAISYSKAYPYSEKFAFVKSKDDKYQFISNTGQKSIPVNTEGINNPNLKLTYKEGLAKIPENTSLGLRYGFLNTTGIWIVKPTYELADDFYENRALVFKDRFYYFIDKAGSPVFQIEDKFVENTLTGIIFKGIPNPNVGHFSQGLCKIKYQNTWGFIDTDGKLKIVPQFEDVQNFSELK